jgi:hypothetical protein
MRGRTAGLALGALVVAATSCALVFGIDSATLVVDTHDASDAHDAALDALARDACGSRDGLDPMDASGRESAVVILAEIDGALLGGLTAGESTTGEEMVLWSTPAGVYGKSIDGGDGFVVYEVGDSGLEVQPDLAWTAEKEVAFSTSKGEVGVVYTCPPSTCPSPTVRMNVPAAGAPTIVRSSSSGNYAACHGIFGCPAGNQCGYGATFVALPADGYPSFREMAVNAAFAYWVTGTAGSEVRCASLGGRPVDSGAAFTGQDLAVGQNAPLGITVDDSGVTWTTSGNAEVQRCPLTACSHDSGPCSPEVLYKGHLPENFPTRIVSDGKTLYWIDVMQGSVVSCPIEGCPDGGPHTLASGLMNPTRLSVLGDRILVADPATGQVLSVAISPVAPPPPPPCE